MEADGTITFLWWYCRADVTSMDTQFGIKALFNTMGIPESCPILFSVYLKKTPLDEASFTGLFLTMNQTISMNKNIS